MPQLCHWFTDIQRTFLYGHCPTIGMAEARLKVVRTAESQQHGEWNWQFWQMSGAGGGARCLPRKRQEQDRDSSRLLLEAHFKDIHYGGEWMDADMQIPSCKKDAAAVSICSVITWH